MKKEESNAESLAHVLEGLRKKPSDVQKTQPRAATDRKENEPASLAETLSQIRGTTVRSQKRPPDARAEADASSESKGAS